MNKGVAVLSDVEIREEIKNGKIILFDPERDCSENINNCSVDITLGEFYYRNSDSNMELYNPWIKSHVDNYWGIVNYADTVLTEEDKNLIGLEIGSKYIKLMPHETILGHTREFVGGMENITTMIKARSSMGRNNVTICRDAGWGDINYVNRWTLEISNNGNTPVILPVGARVGQIVFFYSGTAENPYSGKYQTTQTIDNLVKQWEPSMLLPKLYLESIQV